MPDYGEILRFLANHPPGMAAERNLHASLLELLASCLRTDGTLNDNLLHEATASYDASITQPQTQARRT